MIARGVFVPLVTPFKDDKLDLNSYKNMIDHYIDKGIAGFMPLGTTGESPVLSDYEYETIVEKTMEYVQGKVPVYIGLGGNHTKKVVEKLKTIEKHKVNGILSVSPYYSRPDQRGIFEHFRSISESTDLDIVLYNIPYRTGRNIENETIHRLAEFKNIVGIKDACGDMGQSTDLLLNRPKDLSILTGEDAFFYSTLALGGDGGILASSHIRTEDFVKVFNDLKNNNHQEALKTWKELYKFVNMLFKEPNPTPLKYLLNKKGLIESSEVRLPLVEITDGLKEELDKMFK